MYNKIQDELKGRGYKRKTKFGLLCGIALAGSLFLGNQVVSADEASTQPSAETAVSPETSANKPVATNEKEFTTEVKPTTETKPTTEVKPTTETKPTVELTPSNETSETPNSTEGKKVVVDNGLTKLASELESLGLTVTKEETHDLGVATTDVELSSLKAKADSEVAAQLKTLNDAKAQLQAEKKQTAKNLETIRRELGDSGVYKDVIAQINYLQDVDYINNKTELTNIVSSKGSVTYANTSRDEVDIKQSDVKANYYSTLGFVDSDKPKAVKYSLIGEDVSNASLASLESPIKDKRHATGIPVFLKEGESVTYDIKFAKDSSLNQLGVSYKRVTITLKSWGSAETSTPHTLAFLTSHGSSEAAGGYSHNWNFKDVITGKPFEIEVTFDFFNDKGVKISKEDLATAVYNKIVLKDNIVDNTFFSKDSSFSEDVKQLEKTYHDYRTVYELGGSEHFYKVTQRFLSNKGDTDVLANFTVHRGSQIKSVNSSLFRVPEFPKQSYHIVSYTDNRNADANPNNPATPKVKGSVVQKFVDTNGVELAKSTSTGEKPEGEVLTLSHPTELTSNGKTYVFVKQDKETPKKVVKGDVVVTYTYKEKEQPKPETPKPETPKPETPKPETPKPETPKPETPKPETPKPETPKPETPNPTPTPTPTVDPFTIYVDENGKEISPKEKGTQPPKPVEGYVYNPQHPKNKEDKNGETIRVYKKVQKGGVVQHFVNEEGSKIAESISNLNLEVGSKLELKHPTEITHDGKAYVFVKQDKETPNEISEGIVEVTYTYKLKETPTPTPTPTVESTTIFVDEEGKEISPKEKGTQPPKAIEGYEYDSTNPKNKEDKNGETVRVYKKVKYGTVIQRFVDEQGKELQSSVNTGRLKLGSKLELTFPKELTVNKDKYTFKSQDKETPKEVTSEGELVITYVYAKEVAPVVPTTPTETPSKPSTIVPEVKPSVSQPTGVVTPTTENVAKSTLPNTGSGETLSAAIAGLGLLTLVGLSGRRTKED